MSMTPTAATGNHCGSNSRSDHPVHVQTCSMERSATQVTVGIYSMTSSLTCAKPRLSIFNDVAAAWERSITLPLMNGPRSLTRTNTERLLSRCVTFTRVPKASRGWAAVKSFMLKTSPLAVRLPWYFAP